MTAPATFTDVNAAALSRYPGILESWLPGGRLEGHEYACSALTGGPGRSLKVNIQTGLWSDFATGDSGNDPVSLYAAIHGMKQGEALRELTDVLKISGGTGTMAKAKSQGWVPIIPVPAEAPTPTLEHPRHGKPSSIWTYRDHDGRVLGHVCRFDHPSGDKDVLPMTYGHEENNPPSWRWKSWPEPRPLYGLERLALAEAVAGVLLVEGEKAADAAARLRGPGKVCMTWPGGCKAAGKVDLSPLVGRPVGIWPDADKPGFDAALALARRLKEVGAVSVVIIVPPAEATQGWDLADAEAEGWTADRVTEWMKDNTKTPEEFVKLTVERFRIAATSKPAVDGPIMPVSFDALNVPDVDPAMLPPILGEFCEAVAEGLQVPRELVLINALATIAVAGQRKFKVQVRPDYFEPLNIYALAALPPGERKSATAEVCKRPLVDWEAEAQEGARENIRNIVSERKTLEKAIEAKRARAGSAKTAEDRREIIAEVKALEAELPEVPAAPRLLIDDVTPEAIPAFMERQQERAGIIEAEGGLFDILAGRYSKGVPNLDAVLKLWSGESVHVDRRNGQPIVLHEPALTICLSPQPEVVRGLADKPGFRGRGLLGRFLFLLPKSRVGSREVEPRPIPQAVQVRYADKVRGLLALPWALGSDGKSVPYLLQIATDAYREWTDFHRDVEAELRPGGELELIADWGGKLHGAAARLAGLLHLVEHDAPHLHPIGLGTMQQALGLAAVLTEHAKAAFALMGADPDIECAKHILTWIVDRRIDAFQAREAFEKVKGRYSKMELVKAGLSILEERAYIFPAQVPAREPGKAGRSPSPGYSVNPLAFGGAV